jgi:hypothetical protein
MRHVTNLRILNLTKGKYMNKLTNDDLTWFYNTVEEAFKNIKDIRKKTDPQIEGEVFTFMRRALHGTKVSSEIKSLFSHTLKQFKFKTFHPFSSSDENMEVLSYMFSKAKNRAIKEPDDKMIELRHILLSVQSNNRKMEEIITASKPVKQGLEEITKLIDGEKEIENV